MKRSELKSLLKIIVEEVAAANKQAIQESKGLSGFKKSKDSTEHTEKIAASKDLTGKGPVEKKEGKKLPVVKKPATPQKVGSIKEEILSMIREAIAEVDINEMARVKGAIGSKYKVEDPNSPTGWSVKGHKTIPDGTPTEAPNKPYVAKGDNPNIGRPKKAPISGDNHAANAATKDAIENILIATPQASDEEIMDQLNARVEDEEDLNTDPVFVKNTADEIRVERSAENPEDVDASDSEIAAIDADEEKRKAAERALWIKKLKARKGLK